MTELTANVDATVDFLREVTPKGYGNVVAIDPYTGVCTGAGFRSDSVDGVREFISANVSRNLYWSVNEPSGCINKKLTKPDIARYRYAHLDLDDPSPEALERIRSASLPPTLIIYSGGGFGAFWRLAEPVQVNGNMEELEAVNRRIIDLWGAGKGTWNIDRLMRLPWTVNHLSEKKRRDGREPAATGIVEHDPSRAYTLEQLSHITCEIPPPAAAENPKICGNTVTNERPADLPDRSRDLLAKVAQDVRAGKPEHEILATRRDHPHARDQADPDRAVWRCIERVRLDMAMQAPRARQSDVEPPPLEHIPDSAYEGEPSANLHDEDRPVTTADFWAYMPQHAYIFVQTRELWPAASINSRIPPIDVGAKKPLKASDWLDRNRAVEQMTWAPGFPMVIDDRLVSGGGWVEREGCRTFNLYQPPAPPLGDPAEAGPWLAHVERVYPNEVQHITYWLAHRVQRPGEKLNHALVLGGDEGVGKDTILEPIKYAVGPWNFAEVSPPQLLGRFNGFVKSVILRMSEARDLGDVDRYALHEHLKTLIAAPPDVLRCDEKNLREYSVMNVAGVVVTSNHVDGLYIPADSRRYFIAWSELTKEDYTPAYWQDLYHWYNVEGGIGHVAAYLKSLDLSAFDPKAPPPKTAAFWRVVDAGRPPEDAEVGDALDTLNAARAARQETVPAPAVTVGQLAIYASDSFRAWLTDRKNSRQIPHRMKDAGYVAIRNDSAKDGQWVVEGKRQTVYARRELPIRERFVAAAELAERRAGR